MCELQDLFNQFEQGLRSGKISPETVKTEVGDRIAELMKDYPEIFPNIEEIVYPKERWPEDKLDKEKAIDFLVRVWAKYIKDNPNFLKNELRSKNLNLYRAISTRVSRGGDLGYLSDWWSKSPKRSTEELDNILEKHNIINPEDAFRRDLPTDEAQRLYNAAKSRLIPKKAQN